MIQRILIVCVGNICRSPMAEVVLRKHLGGGDEVIVESAGLAALVGNPIDPIAERVLADHGLTGQGHAARQVTEAMISKADLVLAMQRRHVGAIHAIAPQARGKTFLVGQMGRRGGSPRSLREDGAGLRGCVRPDRPDAVRLANAPLGVFVAVNARRTKHRPSRRTLLNGSTIGAEYLALNCFSSSFHQLLIHSLFKPVALHRVSTSACGGERGRTAMVRGAP